MKPSAPTLLSLTLSGALSLVGCVTSEPSKPRDTTPTGCKEVEENVVIRTQADFDELPDGCWDLYGKLSIEGGEITSLAKLGKLEGVNEIEIVGTNLSTLDAPQKLNVFGPVTVTGNDKLKNLDNMVVERADNLTMEITIDDNALLTTIGDMSRVERVDGDLTITANPALKKVELRGLTRIDGAVHVNDNVALASLDLPKVTSVRDVTVRGNRSLTSFAAMSSLTTIEGSLRIEDNDQLTTISAFTSSTEVALGMVRINGNAALTELGQIARFRNIGALEIIDNQNLSFCKAREVAMCVQIAGSITVQNNKVGTNCTSWCGR